MARLLPSHLVDKTVLELHHWQRSGQTLERAFPTTSHHEAMAFVERLAPTLGQAEHEPAVELRIVDRTVHVIMHTPEQGGITDADVELARRIDKVPEPQLRPVGPGGAPS